MGHDINSPEWHFEGNPVYFNPSDNTYNFRDEIHNNGYTVINKYELENIGVKINAPSLTKEACDKFLEYWKSKTKKSFNDIISGPPSPEPTAKRYKRRIDLEDLM